MMTVAALTERVWLSAALIGIEKAAIHHPSDDRGCQGMALQGVFITRSNEASESTSYAADAGEDISLTLELPDNAKNTLGDIVEQLLILLFR